jgi:hypothetical protein
MKGKGKAINNSNNDIINNKDTTINRINLIFAMRPSL